MLTYQLILPNNLYFFACQYLQAWKALILVSVTPDSYWTRGRHSWQDNRLTEALPVKLPLHSAHRFSDDTRAGKEWQVPGKHTRQDQE